MNTPLSEPAAPGTEVEATAQRAELSVDEARARILTAFEPLDAIEVPLAEALGRVLAGDVVATMNVPPFANAAMDGYALIAEATRSAYRIAGEVAAGHPATLVVQPGTAVRIMTGAPVPAGADAVVRFEETTPAPDNPRTVLIRQQVMRGQNIRPAGEDIAAGSCALISATRLGPAALGVLASLGMEQATVFRTPRVAILATGDEVVSPGNSLAPGQIYDANSTLLTALVREAGGEPVPLGVVRDDATAIRKQLDAAAGADLILTVGGVSVGDYDLVKEVLARVGTMEFWSVRIRPGRPLAFGQVHGKPLIGLPGNPVAAAVAFLQFARPAILRMSGRSDLELPTVTARLLDRVENRDGRQHFVRVRLAATTDGYEARLAGRQGSGVLKTLAEADGLLVIPEGCLVAEEGGVFGVQSLNSAAQNVRREAK